MRRTPLKRRTPLRAKPVSAVKRSLRWDAKREAWDRQHGLCALCWKALPDRESRWWDGHEPLTRARGGNPLDATQVVALHRRCHDWCHAHEKDATARGLMRRRDG